MDLQTLLAIGAGVFALLVFGVRNFVRWWPRLIHSLYEGRIARERLSQELRELRGAKTELALDDAVGEVEEARSEPPRTSTVFVRPKAPRVPEIPAQLRDAVVGREAFVFAGPGVLADWAPTMESILRAGLLRARERDRLSDWTASQRALDEGRLDLAIELLRSRLGAAEFEAMLRESVAVQRGSTSETLSLVAQVPFAGVVTFDWSGAVARELTTPSSVVVTPSRVEGGVEALRRRQHVVVEAAGDAREGEILLTGDDVLDDALRNREYSRFLSTLLATRTIFFVGADLTTIEQFMRVIDAPSRSRTHWAILPWSEEVELQRERLIARYGLRLLPFDGDARDDPLGRFLRTLADADEGSLSQEDSETAPVEHLEEVILRNVGPFDELAVKLGTRTVLLGDNGSGKSSILRAIALALMGELAPDGAADRLLKSTARVGEVVLRTDLGEYRTELIRDGARVRIRSGGFAPIEMRAWLAMGFPPLRGITTANPSGPTKFGHVAPTHEDLMPLLVDAPDRRLDSLKQWVVNASVRADEDPAYQQLLSRFFAVLRDLTPGVEFVFDGIDRRTWEVRLSSPGGPVSFDLLSRGMLSVLGWIGILLQRLHEVYGGLGLKPHEERAVVLVDEIDVHLHPEWQQRLLMLIERHFPGLQLIVTTHSPLIVGNTDPGEVQVLSRHGGVLSVSQLSDRFEGWRSDQILTSGAFGMRSSRDVDTAAKHAEYRELMARGETPSNNARARKLYEELEGRLPAEQETPEEREAVALVREWLRERLAGRTPKEREQVLGEAETYLRRLHSGESR